MLPWHPNLCTLSSLSISLFLLCVYYSFASFASLQSALHIQVSLLISFCFVFYVSHLRIEDLCFLVSIVVRLSYLVLGLELELEENKELEELLALREIFEGEHPIKQWLVKWKGRAIEDTT